MNHSEVRALLSEYLDGQLEANERARVDAHLPDCHECSQELVELRETVGLLRALPDPDPPARLAAAVMARVEAGEGRTPFHVRLARSLTLPRVAAPLAAGFAGVALFVALDDGAVPTPEAIAPTPAPAAPPAQTAGAGLASPAGSAFRGPQSLGADEMLFLLSRDPSGFETRWMAFSESEREDLGNRLVALAAEREERARVAQQLNGLGDPEFAQLAARLQPPSRPNPSIPQVEMVREAR